MASNKIHLCLTSTYKRVTGYILISLTRAVAKKLLTATKTVILEKNVSPVRLPKQDYRILRVYN